MVATATRLAAQRGVTNISFQVADVADLPFPDAHFDLVTSRVAAHHFAEPRLALREAFRVMKPSARLLLIDAVSPEDAALDTFLNCIEILRDASHVRDWQPSEWLTMLHETGFREAAVVQHFPLVLDGKEWVERMRTPPMKVAMIRELFAAATPLQRQAFAIQSDEPWSFTLGLALFQATKPR